MRIFLIVIALVVLFPFLRNCWKAFFHPATILGNQAANMNWIVDGREKDGIVNNMRYRRGNLIAVIPFNNPSVLLRYNGTEKRFKDFIEVERWIGNELGKRELEIDNYAFESAGKDISKNEIETVFDDFRKSIQRGDQQEIMKKELEIEQLCAQLDKGESIRKKELEIDQRVNQKIEKFANYDFESAGKDISKNEMEAVFADFKKSLEGMKSIKDGDTDGFIKSIKDGGADGIFFDLGKRCGLSLGAMLHYHNSKKNYCLDPEEILVCFSYAMCMVYSGFWEYIFDEKKLYPVSLRREQYNLGDSFQALLEAAMISSVRYIMQKDFENDYFKFYCEYDDLDDGEYEFWEERDDLVQKILSVRKLLPKLDERSIIYGYNYPEDPDIDKDGDIDFSFTDYAFIKERLLRNPKEDPIQFFKDTKFLYTPIFVRFFFKPEIDK